MSSSKRLSSIPLQQPYAPVNTGSTVQIVALNSKLRIATPCGAARDPDPPDILCT